MILDTCNPGHTPIYLTLCLGTLHSLVALLHVSVKNDQVDNDYCPCYRQECVVHPLQK